MKVWVYFDEMEDHLVHEVDIGFVLDRYLRNEKNFKNIWNIIGESTLAAIRGKIKAESVTEKTLRDVIKSNQSVVNDYHKNPGAINVLIGKVMKETEGAYQPVEIRNKLEKLLKKG